MTCRRGLLVLRARQVVPCDGPSLDGGWIAVRRGRVVAIGRRDRPADALDLGDAVILPGLVNAHTHLEFSGLRQPLDTDRGLPAWIGRVVAWRRGAAAGTGAAGIAAGLRETAAAGVTAVGEIATSAAVAARRGGPRIRAFREGLGLSPLAVDAAWRTVRRDLDRLAAAGIAVGVSPHAPYSVAAPLGTRLLGLAVTRGLPVAMHIAESPEERELLATGGGPFRTLLEELGAWPPRPPHLAPAAEWISRLARAPRGIVVHGTHLGADADALARLTRHRDRLCVAVCPRTTRALSGLLPPIGLFQRGGIRVALGTDGRGSTPDLSVLAECRLLVDAGLASPAEAIAMATRHGAWALGLDRTCGILAPGRAADLVVLRPASRATDPRVAALDPATAVVATLRGGRLIAGTLP